MADTMNNNLNHVENTSVNEFVEGISNSIQFNIEIVSVMNNQRMILDWNIFT